MLESTACGQEPFKEAPLTTVPVRRAKGGQFLVGRARLGGFLVDLDSCSLFASFSSKSSARENTLSRVKSLKVLS